MYSEEGVFYSDTSPDESNKNVMVLLHGFFMDSRLFKPQVEYFQSQYRVLCFDFRGFGKTKWDKRQFTLDDLALDIVNTLDDLGISKVTLVGMSMGGYVAQRIALSKPNLVESLVLIATQGEVDNLDTVSSYHKLRDNWWDEEIKNKIINDLFPIMFGDENQEYLFWKDVWLSYHPDDIYFPMTAMTSREQIDISNIQTPSLVIHGDKDMGIPPCAAIKLSDLLPNSELNLVSNGHHAINLTHSKVINGLIENFLN